METPTEDNVIPFSRLARKSPEQENQENAKAQNEVREQKANAARRERNNRAAGIIEEQIQKKPPLKKKLCLLVEDAKQMAQNLEAIFNQSPHHSKTEIFQEAGYHSINNLSRFTSKDGKKLNKDIRNYSRIAKAAGKLKKQDENFYLAELIAGCSFDQETFLGATGRQDVWHIELARVLKTISERLKRQHSLDEFFLQLHKASVAVRNEWAESSPMICSSNFVDNFSLNAFDGIAWVNCSDGAEFGSGMHNFVPKACLGKSVVIAYPLNILQTSSATAANAPWTPQLHVQAGELQLWLELCFAVAPCLGACLIVKPRGELLLPEQTVPLSHMQKDTNRPNALFYEIYTGVYEDTAQTYVQREAARYKIRFRTEPEPEQEKNASPMPPRGQENILNSEKIMPNLDILALVTQDAVHINDARLYLPATADNIRRFLGVTAAYDPLSPLRRSDDVSIINDPDICLPDDGGSYDGNGIAPDIYAPRYSLAENLQINLLQEQNPQRLDQVLTACLQQLKNQFNKLTRSVRENYDQRIAWLEEP